MRKCLILVAMVGILVGLAGVGCASATNGACDKMDECGELEGSFSDCVDNQEKALDAADLVGCGTEYESLLSCVSTKSCGQLDGGACDYEMQEVSDCLPTN